MGSVLIWFFRRIWHGNARGFPNWIQVVICFIVAIAVFGVCGRVPLDLVWTERNSVRTGIFVTEGEKVSIPKHVRAGKREGSP